MTANASLDAPTWWASLKHGGMLIAPARLAGFLTGDVPPLGRNLADRLRRDVLRVRDGDRDHLGALLDTVLEDVLELDRPGWTKGSDVDTRWSHKAISGEIVKPRRVWQSEGGTVFPVFVADSGATGSRSSDKTRLGIGRGRRPVSRVVEWLRNSGQKVALLTNGRQWRLVHAGPDYDAWCEWDNDLWFEEGAPGPQVLALRRLLGKQALESAGVGQPPPLIAAILASRRGQAELSAALGERVRLAVERLIRESSVVLDTIDEDPNAGVSRRDIYIAATRLIMRCVVVLFAEARDLLPRDNAIYHDGYGVQGLREQLARLAGGRAERLSHSHSGWPRLISLFRLIYFGSPHEAVPIPRYGGGLFAPGDRESKDSVLRAIAAFEDPRNAPTDAAIHEILELLCVSCVKVRQGRASTWVPAPVDFSDLSSEYLGILYEGLLDFELHRAPDDDAVIFLRIGDEPALPLSRLEDEMEPKKLTDLIGKLRKSTKKLVATDAEEGGDDAAEDAEAEADDEDAEAEADDEDAEGLRACANREEAYSVAEALRKGAADILEMELDDLQILTIGRAGTEEVDVLIYDPMPGGSGLLDQMTERWREAVAAALSIVEDCPSSCTTACVDCLYTFRNAFYHRHLNRHTAAAHLRAWGETLSFSHDIPPLLPATDAGAPPANEAEATLRALLECAGFPSPIGQRSIELGLPLGSTTPDFFYDDPAERLDGICIYLDGMSGHIHGNPVTQRRDREIREELRHRGYEVFEIPYGHLSDREAMRRHFYRLGRILLGRSRAENLRDNVSWFDEPS